jgi:predicted RNA-binding protein with PIN domain
MPLVIDGYNLLHASGILGRGVGPGSLERSRGALLNFLAESLDPRELADTTVVFDAREAPPGLPRAIAHRGIRVRFAPPGSDADQEIEALVAAHTSPRRLTVVSSDHRLHRAARRRRAKAIDSDRWYAAVLRDRIERARTKSPGDKPAEPPTEAEVNYWLRRFGLAESDPPSSAEPQSAPESPFPPGYGEDLGEDDD